MSSSFRKEATAIPTERRGCNALRSVIEAPPLLWDLDEILMPLIPTRHTRAFVYASPILMYIMYPSSYLISRAGQAASLFDSDGDPTHSHVSLRENERARCLLLLPLFILLHIWRLGPRFLSSIIPLRISIGEGSRWF